MQSHNSTTLAQPYQHLSAVLQDAESVDPSIPSGYSRWQDVLDAMEAARAHDQAKADKSAFRARLRKSAPDIAVLESLAEIIPDQDGLSVLRCGLATLFKVSQPSTPFYLVSVFKVDTTHVRRWWPCGSRPGL